jgi:2-alkyl-3-oxoalkanoate reductase
MRVLVVGATGAVGRQLVPRLIADGHQVGATTRSEAKLDSLRAAGAEPYLLDGLDGAAVGQTVARAEPEVVVHEMTAIPAKLNLRRFDDSFADTNRLRTTGVDHLLAAAAAQGVRRFIAQSYAGWPNARSGRPVKSEEDPLDPTPPAAQAESISAIKYLERAVLDAPVEGLVLRYGSLYGPGASQAYTGPLRRRQMPIIGNGAGVWSFLHVSDAAEATALALEAGAPGVYNIVDDEPATVAEWLPLMAKGVGAKPPLHVPAWLGRLLAGEVGVSVMTQVRGSSNVKAKRELGWQPVWATWRDGFLRGLDRVLPPERAAAA